MDRPHRPLIAGAGPAGLCAALALADCGLDVDLVERLPETALAAPAFDGREIALSHASIRALQDLGVWAEIPAAEIHPLRAANVADGARPGFAINGHAFGRAQLGSFVANQHIRRAAFAAVRANPRIHLHAGAEIQTVAQNEAGVRIGLADGRIFAPALLVAADSRFSQIRRLLGVPVRMHDFGKTMLVCRLRHSVPHHGIAREWFGHGQTRALLPLDEHLVSLVLTVPGAEAARLQQLEADAFARAIETRLEQRLGHMELASERLLYPLVATWAERFAGPGFALVGDAAVGMHPVTAHGFNLGLASVVRLADAIRQPSATGNPADPRALARYERRHRRGAWPLFVGTAAVVALFTNDRPLARPLRHAAIGGMRRLRPARDAIAAAVVGARPPRIARGLLRSLAGLEPVPPAPSVPAAD